MNSLRGIKRTEFPLAVRKLAFARCCRDGVPHCENCGITIRAGQLIYEHVIPDGLGGRPTEDNCKCFCRTCADIKTADDVSVMAKADRVARKHFGLTKAKRPIRSAGFAKAPGQKTASRPIRRKSEIDQ